MNSLPRVMGWLPAFSGFKQRNGQPQGGGLLVARLGCAVVNYASRPNTEEPALRIKADGGQEMEGKPALVSCWGSPHRLARVSQG